MSVDVKLCSVLGIFQKDDFDEAQECLEDYAMRSKYGLLGEEVLSEDVAVLAFDGSVDDKTIEECIYNFLASHILIYTHTMSSPA